MSVSVIYHDSRLEGLTPSATPNLITRSVGQSTSLVSFFRTCRDIATANGGIDQLTIMAHGIEVRQETGVVGGGYGITFCREGINLNTVGIDLRTSEAPAGATDETLGFNLLHGLVDVIVMCVCCIADISPDMDTLEGPMRGNGMELCQRIATAARCTVIASDEVQAYTWTTEVCPTFGGPDDFLCINIPMGVCRDELTEIDFGGWEGTVYTINEHGEIVNTEPYPSIWRDSAGTARDPRELTAHRGSPSAAPGRWCDPSPFPNPYAFEDQLLGR